MDTPPGDLDDVELMRLAGQGDERAFGMLVERHQMLVVGTVGRMLGGFEGAEDIAQQVFVRAWRSAARYRPEAKFTTWLLTIARNLVFNEIKRRGRVVWAAMESEEGMMREIADPGTRDGLDSLAEREVGEAISKAIAGLPEMQRMALVLRRYEEMPYEEIAEVLGTSLSAVKSLIFRAREELKKELRPYLGE
jgi:RNA polymerase sigma-70 factor (ECF subfamily)